MMISRHDFTLIEKWIKPQANVLDLACGDGSLLSLLMQKKQVHGYGLEIDSDNITDCLKKGVNVIEQNINQGLTNFQDGRFDVVIMTQALQVLKTPHLVLDEMLRVGRECIVTFPNFGHWRCRAHLSIKGKMPVSKFLHYSWFDTPNIHFCTIEDFEELCIQKNIDILKRLVVSRFYKENWMIQLFPNVMGEIALYHLTKNTQQAPCY